MLGWVSRAMTRASVMNRCTNSLSRVLSIWVGNGLDGDVTSQRWLESLIYPRHTALTDEFHHPILAQGLSHYIRHGFSLRMERLFTEVHHYYTCGVIRSSM